MTKKLMQDTCWVRNLGSSIAKMSWFYLLSIKGTGGERLNYDYPFSEYFFPVNAWNFGSSIFCGGSWLLFFGAT